jgi:hypothetical protein
VSAVSIDGPYVRVSVDGLLRFLNVNRDVPSVDGLTGWSGAFEAAMEDADPALAGLTFTFSGADSLSGGVPDWSGNVWARMKEWCAVVRKEISVVGSQLRVRDLGSLSFNLGNHTPVSFTPARGGNARSYEMVVQNSAPTSNSAFWDAADEGVSFEFQTGINRSVLIQTGASFGTMNALVFNGGTFSSRYQILASNGSAVTAAEWDAAGAWATARLTGVSGEVELLVYPPPADIAGKPGPYRMATSTGPSLTLYGTVITTDPVVQTMYTGADEDLPNQEIAFKINSPITFQTSDVYLAASWVDQAGPNVDLILSVPTSSLPGIGLTAGAVFAYGDANYRATQVQWGDLDSQILATRHTTIGQVDTTWTGQTLGTYDTYWTGKTFGDQSIQPLSR